MGYHRESTSKGWYHKVGRGRPFGSASRSRSGSMVPPRNVVRRSRSSREQKKWAEQKKSAEKELASEQKATEESLKKAHLTPDGFLSPLQGGLAKTKLKVSWKCREFCLQEKMELRERLDYQARTQSTGEHWDSSRGSSEVNVFRLKFSPKLAIGPICTIRTLHSYWRKSLCKERIWSICVLWQRSSWRRVRNTMQEMAFNNIPNIQAYIGCPPMWGIYFYVIWFALILEGNAFLRRKKYWTDISQKMPEDPCMVYLPTGWFLW